MACTVLGYRLREYLSLTFSEIAQQVSLHTELIGGGRGQSNMDEDGVMF